ncbi:MAG: SOS response-associated peptidase [Bacteroidetes bacterium HGW-Bacteroidetes-8]|jgi:putative SOS response-associated peptidase YedK|nr:MAG: SOS response-associated peptidase [Bacteroidetes bacterium HGW-Bacteroidetes-8]
MCFYFRQSKEALAVANRFKVTLKNGESLSSAQIINGFSHPKCAVITDKEPDIINNYSWGLIPAGSDESIQRYTLNARIETLEQRRSYKSVINNRCLIIADGFYEWKERIFNGKEYKDRYLITMEDNGLFAFAGLYSGWKRDNGATFHNSFTILTTQANQVVAAIHSKKRMPVILSREDELRWLGGMPYKMVGHPYSVLLKATQSIDDKPKREEFTVPLF